ncbi:MAG: hypothetical protein AMXMBFR44_1410 [Candidatus Campbellbacteria bacterium]
MIASALVLSAGYAEAVVHPTPLPYPDANAGQQMGEDVAVCDGLSAVGCPLCGNAGLVFVYRDATHVDVISYPGTQTGARFGESLALSDDCRVLVAGAPGDDTLGENVGRIFVFARISGTDLYAYETTLYGANYAPYDEWGGEVAISPSGKTIAGGAYAANNYAGKVSVFWGNNWFQQRMLQFTDLDPTDFAGAAITLSDDTLVATASIDENVYGELGSFYVFQRHWPNTNVWGQRIRGAIPGAFQLGYSVDMLGRRVALGAPMDGDFPGPGAVYIIELFGGAFSVEARIEAPTPQYEAGFGASVSLFSNLLAVGEPGRDGSASGAGTTYLFRKPSAGSWTPTSEFRPLEAQWDDWFGLALDGYGGTLVFGAPFADAFGEDSGNAYRDVLQNIFCNGFEDGTTDSWSPRP